MFPAYDSSVRTDALVQQVLAHFPIGRVARCQFHARGLNDTYKVETGDDKSYFLRIYRAGWHSREEIETEIGVLQHLARRNVSVSVPVARIDGGLLAQLDCAEGKRWAALFTAALGEEIDFRSYTDDCAARYGEGAAKIHRAAESFEGPPLRVPLDLVLLLDRPLTLVESVISHRTDDIRHVSDLANRVRGIVETTTGLEIGFCHGDLHGHNASYKDDIFTFYDFDCCGWGYRAYDLSVFPWAFALSEQTPERIEAMGRAFLKGYIKCRSIGKVDLAAIPAFVAIRQIWLMGLHISLADRFGWGWLNDRYFDRHLKVLRDWQKNFLDRPVGDRFTV
jgi:Ser/Thr protein kinase RdoA (MazF antagonist)